MATFPITVNNTTTNSQFDVDSAVLANGQIVITWRSFDQDGDDFGVYYRILNADGTLG